MKLFHEHLPCAGKLLTFKEKFITDNKALKDTSYYVEIVLPGPFDKTVSGLSGT